MNQTTHSTIGRRALGVTMMLGWLLVFPCTFAATPDCEVRALRAQESIPAEQLADWEPVDDHSLLVWTLHDSRAHLVELSHPVRGLVEALTVYIVTRGHDPNVCACGHDEVVVPGGETARIISIRYLSEKRTAELDAGAAGASHARITLT